MISGKWTDIGKTKGPILRGLYNQRFDIGLSSQEQSDLMEFLKAL